MKERWYEKNGELHFTYMWNTGYVSDGMWKKYITAGGSFQKFRRILCDLKGTYDRSSARRWNGSVLRGTG